ncbi:DegV family protein with EDD domain [Enterococcus sp. PF1-24]|uniref:DegV family protein n=1 Tax=unclassified Enterococcus TaxID=2608891 RepID=UPI0024759D4F|nr:MULTISPECIES: DegV family protein [unclassified Enterococcus]MDH6363567.1 DegV family protein with EDD domain [Enterococcus sp. PFB1-1]MDH6400802.1 DegV family protein with EDD domain [Enterococcus sp. PF1-24]
MNKHKIAILVDSGTDVPEEIMAQEEFFMIPLKIIYKDAEYIDKVTITAEEIYQRFAEEIPSTSLPSGEFINNIFDEIKAKGYEKVIAITISSGLSGTYNAVRLLGEHYEGLTVHTIDTKNIGIGAGLLGVYASDLLKAELPFETFIEKLEVQSLKDKVFFSVATLEYLQKGGRIGLVTSIVGTALKLVPIISCNEDGVYHTVAKSRGRKKSFDRTIELIREFIGPHQRFNLAVAHGNALEEAEMMKKRLLETFPNVEKMFFGQISPALVVHTGPGLLGFGIQLLD